MRALARKGDFWSGLVLAGLGAYIVVQARGWTYMAEDGPGPGFFPAWYGAAMLVLSLALVAGAALKPGPREDRRFAWAELGRALGCWSAFAASMLLMGLVGFAPAFALLAWFIIAVMARQPQRVALPIALGGAILFHVVFAVLLEVELPRGVLF